MHQPSTNNRDFLRLLGVSASGKVADQLSNARTTLPWLLGAIGAPNFFIGLLVPIRESLSMLPQLFLAPLLKRHKRRKQFWLCAAVLQAASLLAMMAALAVASPVLGGLLVVALLVVFSLARCVCSITFKEIMAKAIGKQRRGRLIGYASGVSGPLVLLAGLGLFVLDGGAVPTAVLVALLVLSALLWLTGVGLMAGIAEPPGDTASGEGIFGDALADLKLLITDRNLRMLVVTRALLMGPILSAPFLVTLAGAASSTNLLLGLLIAANGLANTLSSPLWGRFADFSSKHCITAAGIAASLTVLAAFAGGPAGFFGLQEGREYFYVTAFFVLAVSHAGIRTGRKTYVLNIAEGVDRTRYIAVSNTVIGTLLLAVGLIVGILSAYSVELVLLVLGLCGLLGGIVAAFLKKV